MCGFPEGGEDFGKNKYPTTTPEETLDQVFEFFDRYELKGIGIGSFDPIGVTKQKIITDIVWQLPKRMGTI